MLLRTNGQVRLLHQLWPVAAPLQVTQLMVSLLTFYFSEDVRDAAVQALPELLTCAKAAADKGLQKASMQYVKQMLDFIWDKLMESMQRVRAGVAPPWHAASLWPCCLYKLALCLEQLLPCFCKQEHLHVRLFARRH